jgi:chromatin segregation and condensation protein Rec8/ScpA/Scc1 (kleisin family)
VGDRLSRTVPFTERERKIIDALIEYKNYKDAAKALKTTEGNLRNTTLKLRKRFDNARAYVSACEEAQKYLPRKKRYITG